VAYAYAKKKKNSSFQTDLRQTALCLKQLFLCMLLGRPGYSVSCTVHTGSTAWLQHCKQTICV